MRTTKNSPELRIVTFPLYDFKQEKFTIGGLQTYAQSLAELGVKLGWKTTIYQRGDPSLGESYNGYQIKNIAAGKNQALFDNVYALSAPHDAIVVISDQMNVRTKAVNVATIQHGIAFDFPADSAKSLCYRNRFTAAFVKLLYCVRSIRRADYIKKLVCVDYNFFNWFRTIGTFYKDSKVYVIPNYLTQALSPAALEEKLARRKRPQHIVFARRFVDCRGTELFATVAKRLLAEYPHITITFAGEGPLGNFLKETFKNEPRVCMDRYAADESFDFHLKFDIAVVPTIASEGTSLSLLEAMGAGCFPVACHVGGITNILLDEYNGLLTYPDETSFYGAMKRVLEMDRHTFDAIIKNAHTSATQAFSKVIWEKKWTTVLHALSASETS